MCFEISMIQICLNIWISPCSRHLVGSNGIHKLGKLLLELFIDSVGKGVLPNTLTEATIKPLLITFIYLQFLQDFETEIQMYKPGSLPLG